ncbi:hypothetical protein ACLOJK_027273, partial [Asimina triloba]
RLRSHHCYALLPFADYSFNPNITDWLLIVYGLDLGISLLSIFILLGLAIRSRGYCYYVESPLLDLVIVTDNEKKMTPIAASSSVAANWWAMAGLLPLISCRWPSLLIDEEMPDSREEWLPCSNFWRTSLLSPVDSEEEGDEHRCLYSTGSEEDGCHDRWVLTESNYAAAGFERRSSSLQKMIAAGHLGVCLRAIESDLNLSPGCHSFGWLRSSDWFIVDGDLHCSHVEEDAPA